MPKNSGNNQQNQSDTIYNEHDAGYKKILKNKRHFMRFLTKFMGAEWANQIEELELFDGSFIDSKYREKDSDIIYSFKFQGQEMLFFVLLEAQSKVDFTMPFRLLIYMTEVLKFVFENTDEKVRNRKDFRMPAILPIVQYNGRGRWTAATDFKDYLNKSNVFDEYVLGFKYLLFDLNHKPETPVWETDQVLDCVFMLDSKSSFEKHIEAIREISVGLSKMTKDDRDEFKRWFDLIYINRFRDPNTKESVKELLSAEGDGESMMHAIDYIVEDIRKESEIRGEKRGKIEGEIKGKIEAVIGILDVFSPSLSKAVTTTKFPTEHMPMLIRELNSRHIHYAE